jgi:hypothetical protein
MQYFGLKVLSNSLNMVLPTLPAFAEVADIQFIEGQKFQTFDALCRAISTRPTDLDKLFCIFYWLSHEVSYDIRSTEHDPEDVFRRRAALCVGYCRFFMEAATRAGVKYQLRRYSCMAKSFDWDQLHPPAQPSSEHDAVAVQIGDDWWLSEPTWAAGVIDPMTRKFSFAYNRGRFLLPLCRTMNDHYPVGGCESLLPAPFSFPSFVRTPRLDPHPEDLRRESHPFARYESANGCFRMQFSTNLVPNVVCATCTQVADGRRSLVPNCMQQVDLIAHTPPLHSARGISARRTG